MQGEFRLYIDGLLVDPQPAGIDGLQTTIKRDYQLKGIAKTVEVEFIFVGIWYDYFWNNFKSSICNESTVRIEQWNGQQYVEFMRGIIFNTSLEFDHTNKKVSAKVEDDSYYARIHNNKKIEVFLLSGKSKNGNDIEIPHDFIIDMHSVTTCASLKNVYSLKLYDVFRVAIEIITDGEVLFDSNQLNEEEFGGLCLTQGKALNQTLTSTTFIDKSFTFEDLLTATHKKLNTWWYIDETTDKPTFRLESLEYCLQDSILGIHENVSRLKLSADENKMYSIFKLGNSEINTTGSFPDTIDWLGFKEEQYNILGTCNIDSELDLQETEFICDTNTIEVSLAGNTDNNDKFFFIDCDLATYYSGSAKQENEVDGTGNCYYNQQLTNDKVAQRFAKAVPNSIANYLKAFEDDCEIQDDTTLQATISVASTTVPSFDIEITDSGNNYNTAGLKYTAPLGGRYFFEVETETNILNLVDGATGSLKLNAVLKLKYIISHYDSGAVLQASYSKEVSASDTGLWNSILSYSIDLNAGDYVVVEFRTYSMQLSGTSATFVLNDSYFRCVGSITAGGVYQGYNPDEYPVIKMEYEYPLSVSDIKTVIDNPLGLFQVSTNSSESFYGWVEKIDIKHGSKIASLILITDRNEIK